MLDKSVRRAGSSERQDQQECFPWLQILAELLKKYSGKLFQENESLYASILKALVGALQGCKLITVKGVLLECCSAVLQGSKEHRAPGNEE